MKLTRTQEKAVSNLFKEYLNKNRKIIDFSAPTGSGKTFIASNFISRIFASNTNKKTMVIVATISNAELPKAFAKKMKDYKQYLPFKDFNIAFRESPSSSKITNIEHIKRFSLKNNSVIVFGTSSFGKKKLFTEQGILENFILEAKMFDWNIVYIRDEAHKGTTTNKGISKIFYKRLDDHMVNIASFTVHMTATPKGTNDLIELSEEQLRAEGDNSGVYLLKTDPIYNSFQRNTSTSSELIDESLDMFEKIRNEYKNPKLVPEFIRPALLIQVDSKPKNNSKNKLISLEYDKTIDLIKQKLKEKNLKYLKYFSGDIEGNAKEDLTLDSASKNDSHYDAIIFKVGPATGWDIPRACMLLQIREVSSEVLNIQTIGRIKRNPINQLAWNKITDKYYIYSNYQEGQRTLASYKLKKEFKNISLYQGNLSLSNSAIELLENNYSKKVDFFLKKSAIQDLVQHNLIKNKLVIDDKNYPSNSGTDNFYKIYANSIFRLKLWNDQMINQNKKYFTNGIYNIVNKYANQLNASKEIILYTILWEYLNDLKELYLSSYKKQENNEKYKINGEIELVNNYQMWKSGNKENNFDVTDLDSYGYRLIEDINKKYSKNIQYLDSTPETIFIRKILEEIEEEENQDKILFFAKMPTFPSSIYFEYLKSEDKETHKAYIDFALKFQDKVLMIEVKGWNDYDRSKTEDLLNAFKKYKEQNKSISLDLKICYSGKWKQQQKTPEIKYIDDQNNLKGMSIRRAMKDFFSN